MGRTPPVGRSRHGLWWGETLGCVFCAAALCAVVLGVTSPACAFWETERDAVYAEARGFVRGAVLFAENPPDRLLYANPSDGSGQIAARLFGELELDPVLAVQANVLYTGATTTRTGLALATPELDSNRSSALRWNARTRATSAHAVEVDWLSVRLTLGAQGPHPVDVRVGRLPINLATTFYFTPNDFFSPFSADTFFRSYKPGVDGARVDFQLADLTQVSLIGVAGFAPDDDSPRLGKTAGLARVSTSAWDLEWVALAGVIPDRAVAGGALQGEIFSWLGVRGEGHYAWGLDDNTDRVELVLGIDHRFESTLTLRGEQFYHGSGSTSVEGYARALTDPGSTGLYLGRHYSAFGAGYELTPLLVVDAFSLVNWGDRSGLWGSNLLYSLGDEAEVAFVVTAPWGADPKLPTVGSEFGLYPATASVDFRAWF